jgi:peroxiredoxin
LFLYFLFTGSQKNQTTLSIGDAMPAFTAVDDDGEVFDSAALAGTPVLLKFFRGHW